MVSTPRQSGVHTFLFIWFGQLVSLLGTGMTRFALLLWAYQQTATTGHPATTVALLGFCAYIPYLILSPLAGVVVDDPPFAGLVRHLHGTAQAARARRALHRRKRQVLDASLQRVLRRAVSSSAFELERDIAESASGVQRTQPRDRIALR